MKRIIIALIAVALTTGCVTKPGAGGQSTQCQQYQAIYAMYIASLSLREVGDDEVAAAKVAAAFLSMSCGWTQVEASPAVRSRGISKLSTIHGVPLLNPPAVK